MTAMAMFHKNSVFCKIFENFPSPNEFNDANFILNFKDSDWLDKLKTLAAETAPSETVLKHFNEKLFPLFENFIEAKEKLQSGTVDDELKNFVIANRKRYIREYLLLVASFLIQNRSDCEDFEYIYTKLIPVISSQNLEIDGFGKGYESLKAKMSKDKADSIIENLKRICQTKHNADELSEIICDL